MLSPLASVRALPVLCFIAATPARGADTAACLDLSRKLELIRQEASSIELNSLLFDAADKGCEALARGLITQGASVLARDARGAMALRHAAQAGRTALVDLFLAQGAPIDARDLDGSTALFAAAESDRAAVVRLLLERGADANLQGRSAITPLAAAAYRGNATVVDELLAHGAKSNESDATGKTPIVYAAALGFTGIVRRLLDTGVDVNTRYGNDLTALMWAAGYADGAGVVDAEKVVTLLLDRHAAVDAADNRGRTPLMIAAENGHAEIVDLLIGHGADPGLKDKAGKTALDLATDPRTRERLERK
jgi:uncharacterized protein